jgi:hypothetical protein
VFAIGAWRNYEELEESLSLGELLETYSKMMEVKVQDREFHASVMGAEFKAKSSPRREESNKQDAPPLAERLREKVRKEQQDKAKTSGKFAEGVGYRVIG